MNKVALKDHLPLKQGLRPILKTDNKLRRLGEGYFLNFVCLKDHLPLKQGLRLLSAVKAHILTLLKDHLPLKQGLRLINSFIIKLFLITQRPSSSKTRIKTRGIARKSVHTSLSKTIFL